MATKKITQFNSLAQIDVDSAVDVLAIVDVGSSETKKVTAKALVGGSAADLVAVWNNVATTFSGIKLDVTDTASAAGSFLINLLIGGAARFQVTKAGAVTAASSILSTSASAGVGYATGAGGVVTQLTDKSTAVTLNAICGTITMDAATLGAPDAGSVHADEQRDCRHRCGGGEREERRHGGCVPGECWRGGCGFLLHHAVQLSDRRQPVGGRGSLFRCNQGCSSLR
jgi:hypothetical protein